MSVRSPRPLLTLAAAFCALLCLGAQTPALAAESPVRPGVWNPRDPPPGWIVIETDHYQVQSQIGEAQTRLLAEHLESMLALYQELIPFRRRIKDFVLKIFANEAAMLAYRPGARGATAWYDKANRELVSYDTGLILGERHAPTPIRLDPAVAEAMNPDELHHVEFLFERIADEYTVDLARVLSHEGWHQYFHHYTVSWVPMPSWVDEGVGDYFFTATKTPQGGYRLGDLNQHRLRRIHRALEEGTTVPFSELLEFDQTDYYAKASVYYAQGWSMVHFLMEHEDPEYREFIPRLIRDFKDTKNFHKSSDKVFRDVDMAELDREWIGWLLTTEPRDPLRDLAERYGRAIGPGDLEMRPAWRGAYAWLWERHGGVRR